MTTADVGKELDQIRADMAQLKGDVSSLLSSLRDLAGEQKDDAYQRLEDVGEKARARASGACDTLEKEIGERPLASVVTSLVIGFVLGMLLDRRR